MTNPTTADPWVTETGSRIKAWFILRADLPMSEGKLAVQVGHGTDMIHTKPGAQNEYYATWLKADGGNRRKIVLRAKTEDDLRKVMNSCLAAGMNVSEIWDAGLTEFGKETFTGIVVHPHDDALAPKLLQRSQVWKPRES